MKILFLVESCSGGGAERASSILANYFSKSDTEVVMAIGNKRTKEYEINEGVSIYRLGYKYSENFLISTFFYLVQLVSILKIILVEKPDFCVGVSTGQSLRLCLLSFFIKSKVIAWEHNNYYAVKKRFKRILRNLSYFFCWKVVLLTRRDIESYPRFLRSKIEVVNNPIELQSSDISFPKSPIATLLHVGRFCHQKNHRDLIDIVTILRSRNPEFKFKLFLVGDGDLRGDITQLIESRDLTGFVHLCGFVEDVDKYYLTSDLLLLTSHYEGLPMVIIESFKNGLPVISYNCPTGIEELLDDGVNGIVVEHYNKMDFVYKLENYLFDLSNDSVNSFRCNARKEAVKYSINVVGGYWKKILGCC